MANKKQSKCKIKKYKEKKTDGNKKKSPTKFQAWHHIPREIPCKTILLLVHIDWYMLCLFFLLSELLKSNPLIKFGKFVIIVLLVLGYSIVVESVNLMEQCDHTWKYSMQSDENFSVNFIRNLH